MRRQHMPARGGERHVQARRGAEDGQLTGGGDVAALVSEAASMLLLASADGAGPPIAARVLQGAATSTAGAALLDLEDPLSPARSACPGSASIDCGGHTPQEIRMRQPPSAPVLITGCPSGIGRVTEPGPARLDRAGGSAARRRPA
ncbi:hypothetical protein [Streptomyces sp. GMR22]|uniref:hypothetical protein n=1 Tax=Streptomyces sp. GMR22 TaxID=2759524 RepID=UPI001F3152A1|nr:hypothetical protein [Streptomyces sp. GMR22]